MVSIQQFAEGEPFQIELASMAAAGARKKLVALLFVSSEDGSEAMAYRVISGDERRVFTNLPDAIDAYNWADGVTL